MAQPDLVGSCTVCGWQGGFRAERRGARVVRDLACSGCGAVLVYQAEAAVLLDDLGRGVAMTLDELVAAPHLQQVAVLNVGHAGPVRNRLMARPGYQETALVPDRPVGTVLRRRPLRTNQDHQRFTFDGASFDLMTSSHLLEHVPDPDAAFREAWRVLRPGGRYVFTVPPHPQHESVRRAELVDGVVVHHREPEHHRSPEGDPALVFTDFGADVVDQLSSVGFVATLRRPHRFLAVARQHFVVVAEKPGVPAWSRS